jgi:hypothetical protein
MRVGQLQDMAQLGAHEGGAVHVGDLVLYGPLACTTGGEVVCETDKEIARAHTTSVRKPIQPLHTTRFGVMHPLLIQFGSVLSVGPAVRAWRPQAVRSC